MVWWQWVVGGLAICAVGCGSTARKPGPEGEWSGGDTSSSGGDTSSSGGEPDGSDRSGASSGGSRGGVGGSSSGAGGVDPVGGVGAQAGADGNGAGAGSECSAAGRCPDAEVECREGDLELSAAKCGINGRGLVERACLAGRWQPTSTCRDLDLCQDGTSRVGTTACGPNGHGRIEQVCRTGTWQPTDQCRDDRDVCVDGSERPGLGGCGLNGRGQTKDACRQGQWVALSGCADPDVCVDGSERPGLGGCGLNGRGQTKDACRQGQWAALPGCADPDECKDGSAQTRSRYERASVPAGQTCAKEEQVRECDTGKWSGWSGSFAELSCVVFPPQCGNGRLEAGEICDDGNEAPGDGCAGCQTIEPSYACATDASARSICTRCVVLVGPGATSQTGQLWSEAYAQLHTAIDAARALVQPAQCEEVAIWVAAGRYVPGDAGAGNDCSFRLDKPYRLLGGFEGREWSADQRDWRKHPTVLSGDRGGNDATTGSHEDNCRSVLSLRGKRVTVDGFVVSGGHGGASGGGLSVEVSALTLRNSKIEENSAVYGGGLAVAASELLIENVRFLRNTASQAGGALYESTASVQAPPRAVLRDVEFERNQAERGGALAITERPLDVERAVFARNEASRGGAAWFASGGSKLSRVTFSNNAADWGGAVYQTGAGTEQYLTIQNALFVRNAASDYGGALYFSGLGSANVTHCTFAANSAPPQHGGGVYHQSFKSYDEHGFPYEDSGRSFFYNSILWDNPGGEALGGGAFASSSLEAKNCVRGWPAGSTLVACAVGLTPFADSAHEDYRLHPSSLAIDQGLDDAAQGMPLDLAGSARLSGAHPDLGCYEAVASPSF